jgi:hypothetical protein
VRKRPLAARQLQGLPPAALQPRLPRLAVADAPTARDAKLRLLLCLCSTQNCPARLPGWRPPAGLQQGRQPLCRVKVEQQPKPRCLPAG